MLCVGLISVALAIVDERAANEASGKIKACRHVGRRCHNTLRVNAILTRLYDNGKEPAFIQPFQGRHRLVDRLALGKSLLWLPLKYRRKAPDPWFLRL